MATNTKPTMAATARAPPSTRSRRMVQNFHLVWLDESIDEMNSGDHRNSISKLRQVVNTINTFTDVDECIEFINGMQEEKAFIISSDALGQITVPVVHDKTQVSTIFIFCENKAQHEQWANEWPKVKGVYTDIIPICEALKQAAQDCDHNSVSLSFIKTTDGILKESFDTSDSSFMYKQILQEILLTIDFEQSHINDFLTYCREQFVGNNAELRNVGKIRKEYHDHQPIWWYTYDSFLYSMLNRALRLMEIDLIIKIGFFVQDLHNHIVELHAEQYGGHHHSDSFTVYRGQGLSSTDFEQLMKTWGGLMSFNNFLSTSQNYDVSLNFARQTIHTSNLVGVLFVIKIDPSITATPFANVENIGYYSGEEEILFSMHSIFRIEHIEQIDENDRLWQVDLILTGENDAQLCALIKSIREETFSGCEGWDRLGMLLIQLGQFNKAEELYDILLNQTTNAAEEAHLYHMLGMVKRNQGKYEEAIGFYEKSIKIKKKILPPTHSDLATSYNCLGVVYDNMSKYSIALSCYEKALEIRQKALPANHPDLATSYNNIGWAYNKMGEYSKAISYYKKVLEIRQKTLPADYDDLANSYNNIGGLYYYMRDYSNALSYYERALNIQQRSLPHNHPDLKDLKKTIEIVKEKIANDDLCCVS